MNFATVKTAVMAKVGPMMMTWRRIRPEVLTYGGIVGVGATVVLACRATLKASEVLEESRKNVSDIHQALEQCPDKYSEEDAKKDLVTTWTQTGMKMVKLYIPSAALGALSVACIMGGHKVLRKENMALSAAYGALSESYKEYRRRVKSELGEDREREVMHGIKAEVVKETDEDGKEIARTTYNQNNYSASPYARFFDRGNDNWCKSPANSLMFLRAQQAYANNILQSRGYITLNEVYDLIGIPKSEAGQSVGWVKGSGDNYVDFGIFTTNTQQGRDFVNGWEEAILLDFNVDGEINYIYDHLNARGQYSPKYKTNYDLD
jgi:hypothetical protein